MLKSRNLKYFLIISNQFEEGKPSQSRSVELSFNNKQPSRIISPLTDSTVYSMSDINSSVSTTMKKLSQSLKDILLNQKKKIYDEIFISLRFYCSSNFIIKIKINST